MIFIVLTAVMQASEPSGRYRQNGQLGTDPRKMRQEQMREQARQHVSQIEQNLKTVLELANKNQRLEETQVQQAQSVLDESKRFVAVFEEQEKGIYMLLQAWTSFYQAPPPEALSWSLRACKTDEASRDAWNSQALFSILSDKRPVLPRLETSEPTRRPQRSPRRRRDEGLVGYAAATQPYTQQGVLDFDVLELNPRMFQQQLGQIELQTASGEKIEYKPGTDTLCMLLWQDVPVSADDVNDLQQQLQQTPEETVQLAIQGMEQEVQRAAQEMIEGMAMGAFGAYSSQTADIDSQRSYVEQLMSACKDHPDIKFVQINTFAPRQPEALNALPDYSQEPIPMVIAAAPNSNARQFLNWGQEKPLMVIVDTEGKVKFAGPAEGFMPAFILTELTGVEIDLAKQKQQQKTSPGQMTMPDRPEMMDPMMMEMMMQETPLTQTKPADPNRPSDPNVAGRPDPNAPSSQLPSQRPPQRPPTQKQQYDFPTQAIEDQIRAEKLLQSAQMHIDESRKLRMKNPKQGIEDARKVLEEFPNTPYADQARELLRRVPDRWKKQHNITDEELGY